MSARVKRMLAGPDPRFGWQLFHIARAVWAVSILVLAVLLVVLVPVPEATDPAVFTPPGP